MNWKFEEGARVRKTGGYPFPGIIEVRFGLTQMNDTKVERYVVNFYSIRPDGTEGPVGLAHIFAPEQLELDSV